MSAAAAPIALNTYLGADGSPSDRLVIDGGSASGRSGLRVANTTGPGELDDRRRHSRRAGDQRRHNATAAFGLSGPWRRVLTNTCSIAAASSAGNADDFYLTQRRRARSRPEPVRSGPTPADPTPIPARCRQIQSRRSPVPPGPSPCRLVLRRCRSTGRRRWSMPGCLGSPASSAWRSSAPSTSARASRAC